MPTYQYACTACDHAFEAVQSFSDASLTECPQCQGRLRKVFSAVGIVFKGSGFYRTDSRGTSGQPAKADAAPAAAGSTSSAESSGSGAGASASPASAGTGSPAPAAGAGKSSASGGTGASSATSASGSAA